MKGQLFKSGGKLLLSGEYLVLKGATALAVPVNYGQYLRVSQRPDDDFQLTWRAYEQEKLWFEATYDLNGLDPLETNDIQKALFLKKILLAAHELNPKGLRPKGGIDVKTRADFNLNWGLGSSSTLIANIAQWFEIDPFQLHFRVSKGSGYDIACASADGPVFYQLSDGRPLVERADFSPDFKNHLYFVYLGKKQQSHKSIRNFSSKLDDKKQETERVSEISRELTSTHVLDEFEYFIGELEQIMSNVLGIPTVKDAIFAGFQGSVKSLGAWGGDFVMVTWRHGIEKLRDYLKGIGLDVVVTFDDLVKQRNAAASNEK